MAYIGTLTTKTNPAILGEFRLAPAFDDNAAGLELYLASPDVVQKDAFGNIVLSSPRKSYTFWMTSGRPILIGRDEFVSFQSDVNA